MRAAILLALGIWIADAISKATFPTLATTSRLPLWLLIAALALVLAIPGRRTFSTDLARAAIIGGALGNLTDMVMFGYIRDIFALGLLVLNGADIFIGVGLLVWLAAQARMVY